jgi:hypothetical protein
VGDSGQAGGRTRPGDAEQRGAEQHRADDDVDPALERVSETQLEGAKLVAQETRRANRPSNEVVPNRSVFNRRGELLPDTADGPRKPPLKCVMLIPWLVEWESINREEAELLNLLEAGEYHLALIDRSRIKMGIKIDYKLDGRTPSRLLMNHMGSDGQPGTAFNNDNFRLMPPLSDMLRQLLKQHSKEVRARAAGIVSDEEEEALIEAGELSVSV